MVDVPEEPLKGLALYHALLEKFRAASNAEGKLDCGKLVKAEAGSFS